MNRSLVALCGLVFTSAAMAQEGVGQTGASKTHPLLKPESLEVGAKLGMSKVETLGDPVATYGMYLDYAAAENLLLGGALDYWDKSSGTLGQATAEVSDLAAALDAKYIFTNVKTAFRPFALAGMCVHRFVVSEAYPTNNPDHISRLDSKYKDTAGKFGVDFGGGAMYRVERALDVVGEVRYRNIMDPGVSLSQLAFTGGLSYIL